MTSTTSTMGRDDPDLQMLWSPMSHAGHARYAALRHAIQCAYAPAVCTPAQRLAAKYAAGAKRSGDAIFFEAFGTPEQLLRMDDSDDLCTELFASRGAVTMTRRTAREPEPEPEPAASTMTFTTTTTSAFGASHMSRLAKPTRLPTPKRVSLKRARVASESGSAEKGQPVARKPRFHLADTTNVMHASTTTNVMHASTTTTTTTMANPWDRYHALKPSATIATVNTTGTSAASAGSVVKPFGASRFGVNYAPQQQSQHVLNQVGTATTSAFASVRSAGASSSSSFPQPRPTAVTMSSLTSARAFALR